MANPKLIKGNQLMLSNSNLDSKRFVLLLKQYNFLKRPVEVLSLNGNQIDDHCAESLSQLLKAKAVKQVKSFHDHLPKGLICFIEIFFLLAL